MVALKAQATESAEAAAAQLREVRRAAEEEKDAALRDALASTGRDQDKAVGLVRAQAEQALAPWRCRRAGGGGGARGQARLWSHACGTRLRAFLPHSATHSRIATPHCLATPSALPRSAPEEAAT